MATDTYLALMGLAPQRIPHWEHWSCPDAETYLTGIDYYAHPRQCRLRLRELYPQLNLDIPATDEPKLRPEQQADKGKGRWGDSLRDFWQQEEAARRFFVDVAFFSTKGFLPDEGTFESSIAAIRVKQIMAEQAGRVVLMVDHSKFGQRALCKALDIAEIDEVITDAGTPAADLAVLERRGVAVRVQPADHSLAEEVLPYAP